MISYISIKLGSSIFVLDIDEGTSIPLTKKISDINTVSNRTGSYSKTITLKGTKNNNDVLSHLYDILSSSGNFDRSVKYDCVLVQDDVPVLEGIFRLMKINRDIFSQNNEKEQISYECLIYDPTAEFFSLINGLLFENDYSEYNHIWDFDTILDFNRLERSDVMYFFPSPILFNDEIPTINANQTVKTFYDSTTSQLVPWNAIYSISQFYPSLSAFVYLTKIIEKYGYTYEFKEMDNYSLALKDLFIPFNLKTQSNGNPNTTLFESAPNIDVSNGVFGSRPTEIQPIANYGSIINVGVVVPPMTERDFIQSLFIMFNLYLEVDSDNNKNLIIKTRDTYFEDGEVKDWTKKLDLSKQTNISFYSDIYDAKTTTFKFKDGKDEINKVYKDELNTTYGESVFEVTNEHLRKDKKVEVGFAPYLPARYRTGDLRDFFPFSRAISFSNNSADFYLVNTARRNFFRTGDGAFNKKILLCAFNFVKTNPDGSEDTTVYGRSALDGGDYDFNLLKGKTIPQIVEVDNLTYRQASHFYNYSLTKPSNFELSFTRSNNYVNVDNTLSRKQILSAYYINDFYKIQEGRVYDAFFNLSPSDFNAIKLSDKIIVNETPFNIIEVKDYNSNKNETTKVRLVTADEFNIPLRSQSNVEEDLKYALWLLGGTTTGDYLQNDVSTPFIKTAPTQPFTFYTKLINPDIIGRQFIFDSRANGEVRGFRVSFNNNAIEVELIGAILGSGLRVTYGIIIQSEMNIHITYDGSCLLSGLKVYANGDLLQEVVSFQNNLQTTADTIGTNESYYIGRGNVNMSLNINRFLFAGVVEVSILDRVKTINQINADITNGGQLKPSNFNWILNPIRPIYPDYIDLGDLQFESVDTSQLINIFNKTLPLDIIDDFIEII